LVELLERFAQRLGLLRERLAEIRSEQRGEAHDAGTLLARDARARGSAAKLRTERCARRPLASSFPWLARRQRHLRRATPPLAAPPARRHTERRERTSPRGRSLARGRRAPLLGRRASERRPA